MQFNQTNTNAGHVYNQSITTGPFISLRKLRHGAIFETTNGIRAMKTEYRTFDGGKQCDCYLLASGEAAHFQNKDNEMVREIVLP